jgi:hypothetical protein
LRPRFLEAAQGDVVLANPLLWQSRNHLMKTVLSLIFHYIKFF